MSGVGDLVGVFVRSRLVGSMGVPGGGMVVDMVLHMVLRIMDDFVVYYLGFRELEDHHSTCKNDEHDLISRLPPCYSNL